MKYQFLFLFLFCSLPSFCGTIYSNDQVAIERNGSKIYLIGEIVVEAQDGGIMFRETDGKIWMIQPKEIQSKTDVDKPFQAISSNEMGKKIIKQLPESSGPFRIQKTKGFVFVYNTSPAFANWVKGLYLRLNIGFGNYWKNQGVKLNDPDVPLGVVIFKSKAEFDAYSIATLGSVQGNALAYYNMQTNLVVMYDLTGTELFRGDRRVTNSQQLNAVLARPEAASLVATVIHEASHQISFNSGLQRRFGPCPFWVNEGLAMYFEVPDLKSRKGWNAIGKLNLPRLIQLKKHVGGEKFNLDKLFDDVIKNDLSFRDPAQLMNSYAESWAMTYYLMKRHSKSYVAYLKEIYEKNALDEETPEERVKLFEKHFGPVAAFKKSCLGYMAQQ